jgi:hypothetical protein
MGKSWKQTELNFFRRNIMEEIFLVGVTEKTSTEKNFLENV